VAVANAVADGHITVVPEVLVTGGGGSIEGLAATLMRTFTGNGQPPAPIAPTSLTSAELAYDESEGALGTERAELADAAAGEPTQKGAASPVVE
ncbi:MAG: hypothetical protein ACHQDE_00540, partial [Acidimicrobiia bacterium]